MKERMIELLEQGARKAGEHLREVTKMVLAEKGNFNSKTDYDRRSIYEVEADFLLDNGIICPPCKVGDIVYAVSNNKIYKTKVFSMVAETEDKKWAYILKCNIFDGISMFKKFLFGKTVFLTKEEAEKTLKGGAE
jgi:hypothetical protein